MEYIVEEHINDKKTEFYPLVETLFRIIGVDCHKSRDGVNGERWDAMIRDSKRSIPIEIKSPTEEMHISVKAIRQALENKIILLSRKTYITTNECSTYAVGYFPPNDRAEVSDLIENIKKTFGYSIAVFDIGSLIKVSVNIILFNKGIDLEHSCIFYAVAAHALQKTVPPVSHTYYYILLIGQPKSFVKIKFLQSFAGKP